MRKILSIAITLFLVSLSAYSQIANYDQIERRQKLAYLKGSTEPYTGKAKGLYKSGAIKMEITFVNGYKEGIYSSWYESGSKESIKFYKENKLEGGVITWYENGKLERKVAFKQDKKHGVFLTYHENGQKKSEGEYVNGKQVGLHTGWYANGNKESEGSFIDDNPDGIHTEWYESGIKSKETVYKNGEEVSSKFWNEKGKQLTAEEIQALQQQQNGNLMQMWMQQEASE